MSSQAIGSKMIDDSMRHWLRYFIAICERLEVDFESVAPSPVIFFGQVVAGERVLDELDAQRKRWVDTLHRSEKWTDLNATEVVPLRIAILMADIRAKHDASAKQTTTNIEYMGEFLDFGLKKMGYDPHLYDNIWAEYKSEWCFPRV